MNSLSFFSSFCHLMCLCFIPVGEEEQGSVAEVSYYSYEYDLDSEPFLADAEEGVRLDLPEGGGRLDQKVLLPADSQLPIVDTKSSPERWYVLLHLLSCRKVCTVTLKQSLKKKLMCAFLLSTEPLTVGICLQLQIVSYL